MSAKRECTRDAARSLSHYIYEDCRQRQLFIAFRRGCVNRLRGYMGLRVAKFRRLWHVEEQFLLIATAQNIKKIVKLLHRGNKEAREAIQRVANFSNYAIKWFRFIIFQKQSQEFPIALKLLPLVQQTLRLSTPSDGKRFNRPQALTISATATTTSQHFCTT